MSIEDQLRERLKKVEALYFGATTEGERGAAEAAVERLKAKLDEVSRRDPPIEMKFSLPDEWSVRLFIALCRRYGVRPFVLRLGPTSDHRGVNGRGAFWPDAEAAPVRNIHRLRRAYHEAGRRGRSGGALRSCCKSSAARQDMVGIVRVGTTDRQAVEHVAIVVVARKLASILHRMWGQRGRLPRGLRHVCSFACKLMGKPSHAGAPSGKAAFTGFQLPTNSPPTMAPNAMSVSRDSPRHMTVLPGGGSLARAR
jgi:hypothetical protein